MRQFNELTEDVAGLPIEVLAGVSANRGQMLELIQRDLTQEEVKACLKLIMVLLDTNWELRNKIIELMERMIRMQSEMKGLMTRMQHVREVSNDRFSNDRLMKAGLSE